MNTLTKHISAYDIEKGYTVNLHFGETFEVLHPNHAPFRDLVVVHGRTYSVLSRDLVDSGWVTGETVSREGLDGFLHIVRAPDDPQRSSREERKGLACAWKGDMKASSKGAWTEKIRELLADGEPRTFNRIVLELSGLQYSADMALDAAPDHALWALVAAEAIEHTICAPVVFRRRQARATSPEGCSCVLG